MNLMPGLLPRLGSFYQNHFGASTSTNMSSNQEKAASEPLEDSDLDAEGEEADEDYDAYPVASVAPAVQGAKQEPDSDVDAEGEDEDADADGSTDHGEVDEAGVESDGTSEQEENTSWQQESDEEADDKLGKAADSNLCTYCGETEDNDPSDDYEEYLECRSCGENAHRQCARDNGTLENDSKADKWSCSRCADTIMTNGASEVMVNGEQHPDSKLDSAALPPAEISLDGPRTLRHKRTAGPPLPLRGRRKRRKVGETGSEDALDVGEDAEGGASGRAARARRTLGADQPIAEITRSDADSLMMIFRLDRQRLQRISTTRPRKSRWREKMKRKIHITTIEEPEPAHYPALPPGYGNSFFEMSERELEEKKPYGGILSEADADTSKTFPQSADRKRFEDARLKAEEDWRKKMAETSNAPDSSKPMPKTSGPPSKIKCINFGGYEIDTWNAAPYPEEYSRNKILYICEFCLKYMNSDYVAWRHKLKCPAQHPPGDEIYRDGKYSFFEVDGRKNPVYCQNLCLLAKLFLGSKTLYYDVEPFLFYVMTENDELGCHFVGYFSKEKRPSSMNNVSCILVLPIYQRRGFGHMLIEFSYLLTKREQKTGSPEKPLSDMGLVSYRGYWRLIMCYALVEQKAAISISELSRTTGMTPDDVISALEGLRALVRDPVTTTYALRLDLPFFKEYIEKYEKKNYPRINPESLIWTKYLMNRGMVQLYEGGGALPTVAPREEEQLADEAEGMLENGDVLPHEAGESNGRDVEMALDTAEQAQLNGLMRAVDAHIDAAANAAEEDLAAEHNQTNGIAVPNGAPAAIPPTRYEVFPPFPGSNYRKRGRILSSNASPAAGLSGINGDVSTYGAAATTDDIAVGSPSIRRSRSVLDATGPSVNGFHADREAVDGDMSVDDDEQDATAGAAAVEVEAGDDA